MAETDVGGLVALLQRYGYLIVFIAAVVEAMPLIGWFVPGQAIIILAGALAAGGYLSLWVIILIAIPAGILGDAVGYYLGRRYGRAFLEKYGARFRITPQHLERSDRLFQKYGPFALIIARFNFLTRAVGPILAGMAKMRARVFWPINLVGGLAWGVSYAALGFAFGYAFIEIQGVVGKILAWTALAIVGLYFLYRFLKKYATQFTREDLYVALVGGVSGAAFGILADRIQKQGSQNFLDIHAASIQATLQPLAFLGGVVEFATSFQVLGAVALGAALYFFMRKLWWEATLVSMGLGGIVLLTEVLRRVFDGVLPPGVGDGFPGAGAIPLVFAGVVTYLVAMRARRRRVPLVAALVLGTLAALALFARIAQAKEDPSSVVAGLALGASWLCVTVLVVEFRLKGGHLPRSKASNPVEERP